MCPQTPDENTAVSRRGREFWEEWKMPAPLSTLHLPYVQSPPTTAGMIDERLKRIEAGIADVSSRLDLLVSALLRPRYSDLEGLAQETAEEI